MNIHKFNTKPKTTRPKTIYWRPQREVKYPAIKVNSIIWEIFSQEDIKLKQKEAKQLQLGLGFIMSQGVVLTGLANSVVSSCILALSLVTTNRLLGASLRWATGSDDK